MISPTMFNLERLLGHMLDDQRGNVDKWRKHATIVPDYMPKNPRTDTRPRCVVRFGDSFLRYSHGPGQGHFWDMYGDDYHDPELALLALLQAPAPPCAFDREQWREWYEAEQRAEDERC